MGTGGAELGGAQGAALRPPPRKGAAPNHRANGLRDCGAAPGLRWRPAGARAGRPLALRLPRLSRLRGASGRGSGTGGWPEVMGLAWGRESADGRGRCLRVPVVRRAARPSYRQIWMADGVSAAGSDMLAVADV